MDNIHTCNGVPQDYLNSLIKRSEILGKIEKYIDRELSFTYKKDDEYWDGVKATCLDIENIIKKGEAE